MYRQHFLIIKDHFPDVPQVTCDMVATHITEPGLRSAVQDLPSFLKLFKLGITEVNTSF